MPLATVFLLAPPVLLAAAGGLGWCLRPFAAGAGRVVAAGAAWLALAELAAAWFIGGRGPQDVAAPFTVAGSPLLLRVDALTVLLWFVVLVPVALLLTFQRRAGEQAALAALATAAGLATLAAGGLVMAAFGLSTTVTVVLVLLRENGDATATPLAWVELTAAWLLLASTAVLLEVTSGTTAYTAVPVTALQAPVMVLIAASSVLCSGALPWRAWTTRAWQRRRIEAGTLAVALLVPVGLAPLIRAYGLGAGQLPAPQLNLVLTALGAAVALAAAVRAQAASSRRGLLAEMVPLGAGVTLLALGLGTPLGMVAGLAALAGVSAAAALASLAADGRGPLVVLGIALLVGVPPGAVFGGWLLTMQAAVEAGGVSGFLGLVVAAAWLLALAAAARCARLPVAPRDAEADPSRSGTAAAVAVALAAGVGLTALLALLAIPAAAEVMPPTGRLLRPVVSPAGILTAGALAINTASGGWAPLLLGGPLVALGLSGVALERLLRRDVVTDEPDTAPAPAGIAGDVAPLFAPTLDGPAARLVAWARSRRVPPQYRSILRATLLERAAAGPPWFWVAVTALLVFLVTR
jgi:formate hydrogenlyase subunit 3/multisubunit Na+/H+ antiporter MnhD subunit